MRRVMDAVATVLGVGVGGYSGYLAVGTTRRLGTLALRPVGDALAVLLVLLAAVLPLGHRP